MFISFMPCPVCDSGNILFDFHSEQIESFRDVKQQPLRLSLCKECGFVFQNPIVRNTTSVEHYVAHSNYVLEPTQQMMLAKKNQFEWICKEAENSGFSKSLSSSKTGHGLYDIGPSVGALLHFAKDAGWVVGGIEPAPAAVRFAKQRYGIDIQQGELEAISRINLSVVTMIHVLEHIPNPFHVLSRIYEMAPDNALLGIEVPNFSYPKNAVGSGFFIAEHVNYFTTSSLVRCALRAGWEVHSVTTHEYLDAPEFSAYPVVRGVFMKLSEEGLISQRVWARNLVVDTLTVQSIAIKRKLDQFFTEDREVVVFAAGWHTVMLLDLMEESQRKSVRVILDSNPERVGTEMKGIRVQSSADLASFIGSDFIVSSQGYQGQIVELIRAAVGADCRILTFY